MKGVAIILLFCPLLKYFKLDNLRSTFFPFFFILFKFLILICPNSLILVYIFFKISSHHTMDLSVILMMGLNNHTGQLD